MSHSRRFAGRKRGSRAITALVLSLVSVGPLAAQVSDLDVAAFRTRRADNLTVVDGVIQFDPRIAEGGEDCGYIVGIEVRDSAQLNILSDNWRGVLACEQESEAVASLRVQRVVETFQFAVVPGQYTVDISVQPAGKPEAARRSSLQIAGLAADALASDLILGRDVGWVDTAQVSEWTVRKGQIGIAADPYMVADAERSTLAYYLEVYRQPGDTLGGAIEGVIKRPLGDEVIRSRLATLEDSGESRPVAGALSLAGLPPGEYALEVWVELADTVVTRSRGFMMAASFDQPARPGDPLSDRLREYFWGLSDEELLRLFGGLEVWLATTAEQNTFRTLSADGKRQFLVNYFEQVEPDFAATGESALDTYLERIRFVNETFGERAGRGQQAAWRTDRGRVYLVYGKPTDRIERPFPTDVSAPYEIWGYAVGPGYVYLFIDETRFGNFRLIFSTDPREATMPQWEARAGLAALQDLERYFGVRP